MSFRVIVPQVCNGNINEDTITKFFNIAVKKFKPQATYTTNVRFENSAVGPNSERKVIEDSQVGSGAYIADFDECAKAFQLKDFMKNKVRNLASDDNYEILQVGTIPKNETEEHRKELGFEEYNHDAV